MSKIIGIVGIALILIGVYVLISPLFLPQAGFELETELATVRVTDITEEQATTLGAGSILLVIGSILTIKGFKK